MAEKTFDHLWAAIIATPRPLAAPHQAPGVRTPVIVIGDALCTLMATLYNLYDLQGAFAHDNGGVMS